MTAMRSLVPKSCRWRARTFGALRPGEGAWTPPVSSRETCAHGSSNCVPFLVRARRKNANKMNILDRKFCIAPMMEWTDRHCRFFHRLLTRRALIYTEMITTGAVLHGERARLMALDPAEHPVALQLGGCDPQQLAECARIAEEFGYDEVNLNVGCPSDRVQVGRFGACLMAEPALVGDCVAAMTSAVTVPITVKCRIGIDDQ